MATLTTCRKRHGKASCYSAFSEELCAAGPIQLSRPSSQQRAGMSSSGKSLLDAYAVQAET